MPENKKSAPKEKTKNWKWAHEKRQKIIERYTEINHAESKTEAGARSAEVALTGNHSEEWWDDQVRVEESHYVLKGAAANTNTFQLFDAEATRAGLVKRLASLTKKNMDLQSLIEHSGFIEPRVLPDHFEAILNDMDASYPHFHAVTQHLRRHMCLSSFKDVPILSFGANILLNGPAGVGKSAYLFDLSERFKTSFHAIDCAAASNGMDLVGLSSRWNNGQPGKLYDLLFTQQCPNPIIMLDEVEKAQGDSNHPFANTLFALLEKNNAKRFSDEFIEIPMDASLVNWVATSNDASLLKGPVLDRFKVLEVKAPSTQDLKTIIPNLFKRLVQRHALEGVFHLTLDDEVIDSLALLSGVSLRIVNAALEDGLAVAGQRCKKSKKKSKGKIKVMLSDLEDLEVTQESNGIGFIWG